MKKLKKGVNDLPKRKNNTTRKGKDAEERLNLLKKKKKTQLMYIAIIACIVMVSVTFFILFNNGVIGTNDKEIGETIGDGNNEFVYINQSQISYGQLHYYEYTADNNKDVRYFLVKAFDGTIRGAFDLCVKLHPAKSGWSLYENYYILCNDEKCTYPIAGIGTSQPGCCRPIVLPFEVVEGDVRISTESLEDASQYF